MLRKFPEVAEMIKKIIVLSVFALLFIGGWLYTEFGATWLEEKDAEKEEEKEWEDYDDELEKAADDYGMETRLPFQKDMQFVVIGEINTAALAGNPVKDVGEQLATYNEETESIYFYGDRDIPREDDNMIALFRSYDMDVLLEQAIETNEDELNFSIPSVSLDEEMEQQFKVVNENRLFLRDSVNMEQKSDESIEITDPDGDTSTLGAGESTELEREEDVDGTTAKSKVVITNFGEWPSHNMKYIVDDSDVKGGL